MMSSPRRSSPRASTSGADLLNPSQKQLTNTVDFFIDDSQLLLAGLATTMVVVGFAETSIFCGPGIGQIASSSRLWRAATSGRQSARSTPSPGSSP